MELSLVSNKSTDGTVLGRDDHSVWSGHDQLLGDHFWNFLTEPDSEAIYCEEGDVERGIDARFCNDFRGMTGEEIDVEDDIGNGFHNESVSITTDEGTGYEVETGDILINFEDYNSHIEVPDGSYVQIPRGVPTYHSYSYQDHNSQPSNDIYGKFKEATYDGDDSSMKEFIEYHNEALTIKEFKYKGTALHQTLRYGEDREHIAMWLVDRMKAEELEITDEDGCTPLALATVHRLSICLMDSMIAKNPKLPNIGETMRIPVVIASWKCFEDITRFLYAATDDSILSLHHLNPCDITDEKITNFRKLNDLKPEVDITPCLTGIAAVQLLTQCITINLFGIATDLVVKSPEILYRFDYDKKVSPILALAKTMSALRSLTQPKKLSGGMVTSCEVTNKNKKLFNEALEFLEWLCGRAKPFDIKNNWCQIDEAMMEAAKNGNIEFITVMLKAVRELINANVNHKTIIWEAAKYRQANVFNLIYGIKQKESFLSYILKDGTNILHYSAELPHSTVLGRISDGPAYLQVQREVQWFQEVQEVAIPRYRYEENSEGLTPSALFAKSHATLLKDGEESLKETAKAATIVGGLLVTTMFAAAFAVIGGNIQVKGPHQSIINKVVLAIFIVCDAISLFWSASSILVFLGILASRYSYEDYRICLPLKFIRGFHTLFLSILTMALAFSCALFLMIQGRFTVIVLPVFLFSLVPVFFFLRSMGPLLRTIRKSTNESIFDKNTKLPSTGGSQEIYFC